MFYLVLVLHIVQPSGTEGFQNVGVALYATQQECLADGAVKLKEAVAYEQVLGAKVKEGMFECFPAELPGTPT